ncbi:ultraviolet-B receptor UVR8 [Iris pallida]|uniref:Ultraviolet-B receptor UVR8 n=1 Tax=Iris pallida TaxID=29817 RepID=A0AAX6EYL4_IRIPA|nr:ultraviolet-B receptor UVR8 [Iris pallida]
MMHTACISEEGILFVFGEVANNKLGFGGAKGISMPSAVQELPFSEDVACGGYHTSVITSGGDLYTWGSNENGCLGLGCTNAVPTPEVVKSSLLKPPISKVSCGWKHSAVIAGKILFFSNIYSSGNVFTWGWGGANGTFFEEGLSSGGQLGHGDDVDYFEPMIINTGSRVKALHVSCGFNHTGGIFEYMEL